MQFKVSRKPTHPGSILKYDCMEPLGMTVTEFASLLGISRNTLSKILNERASITPNIALRLSRAFPPSARLWLGLQMKYDLWAAENNTEEWKTVKPIEKELVEGWDNFDEEYTDNAKMEKAIMPEENSHKEVYA